MSRKLELSRRRKLTFIASLMQKVERRAQDSFEVENDSVNARMVQKVGRRVDGERPCGVSRHSGLLCTRTRQDVSRYRLFLILAHILFCTFQSSSVVNGRSNLSCIAAFP